MRRLLIRPGAIGDCVLSFPALRHVVAEYTEAWVPSAVVPLVQFADRVCCISSTGLDLLGVGDLVPPSQLLDRLRGFDSIVSWYGANRPEFRATVEALKLPFAFHAALPPSTHRRHATDFFSQQVDAPVDSIPHIEVTKIAKRNTVVIHPFSGGKPKNWPLQNFQALAARLPLPVEWCAGPEEDLPDAARFNNLLELATWMNGARLYIGNDSGITHLAAATGMPVLALFGATDPAIWAPRGQNVTVSTSEPMHDLGVNRILQETLGVLGCS